MHKKTAADAAAFSTEEINQCCAQHRSNGCLRRVAGGRAKLCALGNKYDE
jgi:hypothetical protein